MGQPLIPTESPPPRPTAYDDEVIAEVVRRFGSKLKQWLKLPVTEGSQEDLTNALKFVGRGETYRLARYLEDEAFWTVNDELLSALEAIESIWLGVEQSAVKKWVLDNRIEPEFKVGERVSISHKGERIIGEVCRIDHDLATYSVYVESLGHVRKGIGTLGFLIPYENAKPVKDG